MLLVLAGIYGHQKRRDTRVFTLASGSFSYPQKPDLGMPSNFFLFHLLGWSFPKDSIDNTGIEYLLKMLESSFKPELSQTFIAEIMGIGIIVIFAGSWIKKTG